MKNVIAVIITGTVLTISGFAAQANGTLTNKEVMQLTASAKTPEEHMRLARHFQAKADKLEAEAKEHANMARNYRANPTASKTKRPGASDTASHCETLSQDLAKAARDARALAADHEAMAKQQ